VSQSVWFPGAPVTAHGGQISAAAGSLALPTPSLGYLQYLHKVVISIVISGGGNFASVMNYTGIAIGSGGSLPQFNVQANATANAYYSETFPYGWPASTDGTAIAIVWVAWSGVVEFSVDLYGFNVPQ
jgi:hypothetical protein